MGLVGKAWARATGGASRKAAASAAAARRRTLIGVLSGVEDDLDGVADPLLDNLQAPVHGAEREGLADQRLGPDAAGGQQGQGAPHAGAALAALRVDRQVAAHGVADVGRDRAV